MWPGCCGLVVEGHNVGGMVGLGDLRGVFRPR